jgi:ABC-type transport system involved in cytochrome bd biosynthesis fused ATPase/permease subunit
LDEAAVPLDTKNKRQLQTLLSRLIQDKTALVIARRMRAIELIALDFKEVNQGCSKTPDLIRGLEQAQSIIRLLYRQALTICRRLLFRYTLYRSEEERL